MLDIPAAITLGSSSRIYVTGGSASSFTNWDFATVKYNASTGAQVTVTRNSSSSLGFDHPTALAKDQYDNIYVTGAATNGTHYDIKTVKFDDELNTVWSVTWDNVGLDDQANSIGVDVDGYVYLTGYTKKANGGSDFITIKYNSSGTVQWEKFYSAPDETKSATARKLDIDPFGHIFVTGDVYSISNTDFLTLAYDATGNIQFQEWFIGIGNGNDIPMAVKAGVNNLFYVTGRVWTGTQYSYLTVKYEMIDYITPPDLEICPSSFAFFENDGQIMGTDGAASNSVKFYSANQYPKLYFQNAKVIYAYNKLDTIYSTPDTFQRIDLSFPNNLSTKPYKISPRVNGYLNYFIGSSEITQIYGYQRLLYPELYNKIDLMQYGNNNGLKYYFICDVGSRPQDIQLKYEGASSTTILSNGNLKIHSSLGDIIQQKPTVFQIDNTGNIVSVSWQPSFNSLGNNRFSLIYGSYDATKPLIVEFKNDPLPAPQGNDLPDWCTYYGGGADRFNDVKTDNSGNVYVTGYTTSTNFPLAAGVTVVQSNLAGGSDAIVVKFDDQSNLKWATFYGGSVNNNGFAGNEEGYSIAIDLSGNVYFVGRTDSEDFPPPIGPAGSYQVSNISCSGITCTNAFVAEISTSGFPRIWSTKYGGTGVDLAVDMSIDANGNVIIVGVGDSNTPTNTVSGAYNETNGNGFITKFSPQKTLLWATNFGTSSANANATSVAIDKFNNIYVCGATFGSGLPIINPGAYSSYQGTEDGFIIRFNATSNNIDWSTYFGSVNGIEVCQAIEIDDIEGVNKVIVTGYTGDSDNSLLLPSVGTQDYHDNSYAGGPYDAFVLMFDGNSGDYDWGTLYGGSDFERGQNIAVDDFGPYDNFYITGYTPSDDLDMLTSNPSNIYSQSESAGDVEAFVLAFNGNRELIWSTYFGGLDDDRAAALATFKDEKIYLVGVTSTTDASTFPLNDLGNDAYYQDVNNNTTGYISQFSLDDLVGISEIYELNETESFVFPNPNAGSFNLQLNGDMNENLTIKIQNTLGQIVYQKKFSKITMNTPFYLLHLPNGYYQVIIEGRDNVRCSKFLIQK